MLLSEIQHHGQLLGGIVIALWVIEGVDQFLMRSALDQFGIMPRRWQGLRGIIFAPVLHGNFRHLAANTMPFLILGWFVLLDGERTFAIVTAMTWVLGGFAVWLLGRSRSNHIGASGVIFGYLGYVLTRGYLVQSTEAIALAITAGFLYSGLIWGMLPQRGRSSWEGHLFGFVSGVLAAYYLPDLAALVINELGI